MLNKELITLVEQIQKTANAGTTISTAESCTGGMLAAYLTEVPGASKYFTSGIISYSNKAKIELLSVKPQTLETFGAVSEEVAKEMAIGSLNLSGSNVAISITGIAGPDGGTIHKPVGMVCFGVATASETKTFTHHFKGNRAEIRSKACAAALKLSLDYFLMSKDSL